MRGAHGVCSRCGRPKRVHPPGERRQEVRGAVGPDELQRRETLEHPFGDHVHLVVDVVERHEADVLLVGAGVSGRRRRERDALADLDVRRHGQVGVRGRFPQRPELRLSVQLAGLQGDADLHDARVVPVFVDLPQRAGDVVRVDPQRAAEPVAELLGFEPARHHHLVVCGVQGAAQVPVGHDAACHRMQDRHVDAALVEQLVGDESGDPSPGTGRPVPWSSARTRRPGAPYQSIS